MLIFNSRARQKLCGIVRQISGDGSAHEDLMQEALVHLWQQETETPAQTESWYLQSCRFHLLNYLNRGRSVDSFKHRQDQHLSEDTPDLTQMLLGKNGAYDSPLESVCALDIVELLSKRLSSREQEVFAHLMQGAGPREIARRLSISHQSVSKHRQKLAAIALKMGITPLPQSRNGSNPISTHPER